MVEARLGKTLSLSGGKEGLAACVAALRGAVDGKLPDKPKDDAHGGHKGEHGKGHDDGHAKSYDKHGEDKGHDGHGPTSSVGAAAANITINVAPSAPAKPDKPGHDPHHPAPEPRKEMTVREQTSALRLAVAAFNEHWRHKDARTAALRGALAELSGGGGPGLSHG